MEIVVTAYLLYVDCDCFLYAGVLELVDRQA